jgi:copper chaperone CopZ
VEYPKPESGVTLKKSLTRLDGVKDAKVAANPRRAVVTYDPTRFSVKRLVEATRRMML